MQRNVFGFCVPGYNWCGPGCNGPGAPTNRVDACCRLHDRCINSYGPSCRCDRQFLNCLHSRINPYSREGQDARFFYNFMRRKYNFDCRNFQ